MANCFLKKYLILKPLLFLILVLFNLEIFGQQPSREFRVELYSGLVKNTTSNRLLNYYSYSGTDFMPVLMEFDYFRDKNMYIVNLQYNKSRLTPMDIEKSYYPNNYVNHSVFRYDLSYYRKIIPTFNYWSFNVGISNNSYFVTQKQYYENQLFDNNLRYRKAYTYSFNFSPGLKIDFNYNRQKIELTTAYSLFNITSRPDDNYVKQIGFENQYTWRLYLLKDIGFHFSAVYHFNVTSSLVLVARYSISYYSNTSPESKYLQRLYLLGIAKTF